MIRKTNYLKYLLGIALLISLQFPAIAFNRKIDSLTKILPNLKDTNLLNTLNLLGNHYQTFHTDSSLITYERVIKEADLIISKSSNPIFNNLVDLKKGVAIARKGLSLFNIGKYTEAEIQFNLSLKIASKYIHSSDATIKQKALKLNTISLNHLGNLFSSQADYSKATSYFLKALQISEILKNNEEIAKSYTNIGLMYFYQSDLNKASDYFNKSLTLAISLGNKRLEANTYGNLANIHNSKGEYESALELFSKAYKLCEALNDLKGMQLWQGNVGLTYDALKQPAKAIPYFEKALQISEQMNDLNGASAWKGSLGSSYIKLGEFKKAEKYLKESLAIAEELGLLYYQQMLHHGLSHLYDTSGNYAKSLAEYKTFISIRDSINNDENIKEQTRLEMNYENDKKMAIAKAEQEKKDALQIQENQKQKIILASVLFGLLIISGFSIMLYRRFKITQSQKGIIEKQKHEVDNAYEKLHEKNKEVMDSIHYAARIQRSLITNEKSIASNLRRLGKLEN